MSLCRHTWSQEGKDVVGTSADGLTTTRYTHKCPSCGKVKVTVRASRALPPADKWMREMEKLLQRAADDGYAYHSVLAGVPLRIMTLYVVKDY